MATPSEEIHTRTHESLKSNNRRWPRQVETVRVVTGGRLAIIESDRVQEYVPPRSGHLVGVVTSHHSGHLTAGSTSITHEVHPRYLIFLRSCDLLPATSSAIDHAGGTLDRVDPVVNVTKPMETWKTDVTGDGAGIFQFGRLLGSELLLSGRACVMVGGSGEDPQLSLFPGESVRYWEHDATRALVELILRESDSLFWQLVLVEGMYKVRRHEKVAEVWITSAFETPTQSGGVPWTEIPADIADMVERFALNPPPYYDLAEQNLAHFRTTGLESRALEDAAPTPVLTGDLVSGGTTTDGTIGAGTTVSLASGEGLHLKKGSTFDVAEGSGSTAGAANVKLERLEQQMTDSFRRSTSASTAAQSGVGIVAEAATRAAVPARVADVTSATMTRILQLAAPAFGPVTDDELMQIAFTVDVDLIATILEGEENARMISESVAAGELPLALKLDLLRRRKALPPEWTVDRIAEELAAEASTTPTIPPAEGEEGNP